MAKAFWRCASWLCSRLRVAVQPQVFAALLGEQAADLLGRDIGEADAVG